MKFRLSNKSSANFALNSEGFRPYEAKFSKPVGKIYTANTVFSVRSNGLTCRFFRNAADKGGWINSLNNSEAVYTGCLPIVKFWYENGFPETLSGQNLTSWGLKLTGYFQSDNIAPNYVFDFAGEGVIHSFKFGGIEQLTQPLVLKSQNQGSYQSIVIGSLSINTWYAIEIIYVSNQIISNPAGLVVRWNRGTGISDYPEDLVLSAGRCALESDTVVNGDMPIPFVELNNIVDIDLTRTKDQISTLKFSVPFCRPGSTYQNGYAYQSTSNYYYDIASPTNQIKKHNMIQFKEGYRNSSDVDELVSQFVGQIREINTDLTNSGDKLDIMCYDYSVFTKDHINTDSPTPIDYLAFGYNQEVLGHVNGITKPQAYDGWELWKAVGSILINSYIDPYLFTGKKMFTNRTGSATTGLYNMSGMDITPPNYLPVQEFYGDPDVVNGDSRDADDSYLFKISVGENNYDTINKFLESYAMGWGFTSSGYPFVKAYDVPTKIIDDRETSTVNYSVGWTQNGTDVNGIRATYSYTTTKFASCSANFTGSKVIVLARLASNGGHATDSSKSTVTVRIRKGATIISDRGYNLYCSTPHAYYDGVKPDLAYNPSILLAGNNLIYDTYNVSFIKATSSYVASFDGIFVYDEDVESPYIRFKSGDLSTPASLISADISDDSNYLRNESIVIGSRIGTKVAQGDKRVFDVVNPNNPIFEHIVSRTVDINSIYKSTASNFVGRPLRTLIFDPAITDQDQADFLGYGLVNEYRLPNKEVSFVALNNPLIDVGDCITIRDDGKNSLKHSEKLWITSIKTNYDKSRGVLMSVETTPVRPITSWFSKPEPRLSDFSNQPFQNVKIYNGGFVGLISSTMSRYSDQIKFDFQMDSAPAMGYVQIIAAALLDKNDTQVGRYPSTVNLNTFITKQYSEADEILQYNKKSTAGQSNGKLYIASYTNGPARYLQYTRPTNNDQYFSNQIAIAAWDQYSQDGMGISPIIQFDLIRTGKVKCFIEAMDHINNNNFIRVDNLTWRGEGFVEEAYKHMVWGESRKFTWGGLDTYGNWNQRSNDPELKVHKNTFCAEQYLTDSIHHYPYNKYRVVLELQDANDEIFRYTGGWIYTRRGKKGRVDLKFEYTGGCFYYNDAVHTTSITTGPLKELGNGYYTPVFFNENTNGGKGLKYTIEDEPLHQEGLTPMLGRQSDIDYDPYYYRYYGADIKLVVKTVVGLWRQWERENYNPEEPQWHTEIEELDLLVNAETNLLFNQSVAGEYARYINPKKIKPDIQWISLNLRNLMIERFKENVGRKPIKFLIKKILYVKGNIKDKSGRIAFQYPVGFTGIFGEHWVPPAYDLLGRLIRAGHMEDGAESEMAPYYETHFPSLQNKGLFKSDDVNMRIEANTRGNFVGWIYTADMSEQIAIWHTIGDDVLPDYFNQGFFFGEGDF